MRRLAPMGIGYTFAEVPEIGIIAGSGFYYQIRVLSNEPPCRDRSVSSDKCVGILHHRGDD